jgi:hypothetical protein
MIRPAKRDVTAKKQQKRVAPVKEESQPEPRYSIRNFLKVVAKDKVIGKVIS